MSPFIRTERSKLAAPYVLLYAWGDDHLRSAMRCRHALIHTSWDHCCGLKFHNNFWAHIEIDLKPLNALAERLGTPGFDVGRSTGTEPAAERIKYAYGFAATRHIIEKADRFCQGAGKHLLVLLQRPDATRQVRRGEARHDREMVEFLNMRGVRFFDMNVAHGEDYRSFNLSVDDSMKRFYASK